MPSRPLHLVFVVTLALAVLAPAAAASTPVPDQYIVVLADRADSRVVANEHARRLGVRPQSVYGHALRGYAARLTAGQARAVRADRRVQALAPVFPLDPIEGSGGGSGGGKGQVLPTGVDRIEADAGSARSGDGAGTLSGPAVAVLDGGIDPAQPDLNVAGGVNCAPDASTTDSYAGDSNGHGTHVAGTIGARDDSRGVVGVAPGVPLYAVRVVQSGAGSANTTAHLLCGIDWINANASKYGIKVVNASLGYTPQFGWSGPDDGACGRDTAGNIVDPVHVAVCTTTAAGISFVAAMGNSTIDFKATAPAAFDEVLAVSAIADFNGRPGGGARPTCSKSYGTDDSAATFSNFTTIGNLVPDADWSHAIAAPGVCITSTAPGTGTAVKSGTSMASPAVAGTIALCIASGPCSGLTPAQTISKLRADAFSRRAGVTNYGFTGEPAQVNPDGTPSDAAGARYYGPLVYAGGY